MTSRFPRTTALIQTAAAASLIALAGNAHAQFGGLFQSVINSAVQQGAQQAAATAAAAAMANQVAPQAAAGVGVGSFTPAQMNAFNAAAAAIPQNDPEYQALMIQSLAQVPAHQRSAVAPIIDQQVRQALASRRLGYALPAGGLSPAATQVNNPLANTAVQAALNQGLINHGGVNAASLGSDAGKAAAAGALIQGLGSFFSSTPAPAAPATQP